MKSHSKKYVCAKCGADVYKTGDGLGTWHCTKGCAKRRFTVTRRQDAGKENDSPTTVAYPVRRAIAVRVKKEKKEESTPSLQLEYKENFMEAQYEIPQIDL